MTKTLILLAAVIAVSILARTAQPPMPNPLLTPGRYQSEVKVYEARPVVGGIQVFTAFQNYGIFDDDRTNYVMLCLVPQEMGGTVTADNLWPVSPLQAQIKTNFDAQIVEFYKSCLETNAILADQCRADIALNWPQTSAIYLK